MHRVYDPASQMYRNMTAVEAEREADRLQAENERLRATISRNLEEIMDDAELDEIQVRCLASTPGPWEWRDGVHTDDTRSSDAGGIHTQSPVLRVTPDGRPFEDDNVAFPIARVGGHPYWVEKFRRELGEGKKPLTLALELFARPEDKVFILASRTDVPKLLAEVRRLRSALKSTTSRRP